MSNIHMHLLASSGNWEAISGDVYDQIEQLVVSVLWRGLTMLVLE